MRNFLLSALALAACSADPSPSNAAGDNGTAAVESSAQANASTGAPASLSGSRDQQIAQVLARILERSGTRDWDSARSAFPRAAWQAVTPLPAGDGGGTHRQEGAIRLGGAAFEISLSGTRERVNSFYLSASSEQNRDGVLSALQAQGVAWRRVGCLGYVNYREHVQLTANGRSARLQMHEVISRPGGVSGEAGPNGAYEFDFARPPEQISAAEAEQYCRYDGPEESGAQPTAGRPGTPSPAAGGAGANASGLPIRPGYYVMEEPNCTNALRYPDHGVVIDSRNYRAMDGDYPLRPVTDLGGGRYRMGGAWEMIRVTGPNTFVADEGTDHETRFLWCAERAPG
jgi:hypothetical protein